MLVRDSYATSVYFFEGIFCCGLIEARLYLRQRRTGPSVKYKWLAGYWLVFLVAYAFWWMDKTRLLCNPGSHWISGHGIWHLLDAVAIYFVYLFYCQFDTRSFGDGMSQAAESSR